MNSVGDEQFQQRLLSAFRREARACLHAIVTAAACFQQPASASPRATPVEDLYRAAHSLCGAARVVNDFAIESLCASLEDAVAPLRDSSGDVTLELREQIGKLVDALALAVAAAGTEPGANVTDE